MKKIIEAGEIGDLLYLHSQRLNLGRIQSDVNAFTSIGPHDVSIANFLVGKGAEWVSARGARYLNENVDDVVFVTVGYPGGVLAHMHVSWLDPSKTRKTTVVGSKQMMVFDDVDSETKLRVYDKGADRLDPDAYGAWQYKLRDGAMRVPSLPMAERSARSSSTSWSVSTPAPARAPTGGTVSRWWPCWRPSRSRCARAASRSGSTPSGRASDGPGHQPAVRGRGRRRAGGGQRVEEFCVIGRSGPAEEKTVIARRHAAHAHRALRGQHDRPKFATGHHALVRESNTIGENVSIGSLSVVEHHVTLGDRVRIHSQCFIPEFSVIEEDAWIGPRVTLTNAPFPRCPSVSTCMRGVHIEKGAKIGQMPRSFPGYGSARTRSSAPARSSPVTSHPAPWWSATPAARPRPPTSSPARPVWTTVPTHPSSPSERAHDDSPR